jgi:hypothetical protein
LVDIDRDPPVRRLDKRRGIAGVAIPMQQSPHPFNKGGVGWSAANNSAIVQFSKIAQHDLEGRAISDWVNNEIENFRLAVFIDRTISMNCLGEAAPVGSHDRNGIGWRHGALPPWNAAGWRSRMREKTSSENRSPTVRLAHL